MLGLGVRGLFAIRPGGAASSRSEECRPCRARLPALARSLPRSPLCRGRAGAAPARPTSTSACRGITRRRGDADHRGSRRAATRAASRIETAGLVGAHRRLLLPTAARPAGSTGRRHGGAEPLRGRQSNSPRADCAAPRSNGQDGTPVSVSVEPPRSSAARPGDAGGHARPGLGRLRAVARPAGGRDLRRHCRRLRRLAPRRG